MKHTIALLTAALLVFAVAAPLLASGAQEGEGGAEPLVWYVPGGAGYPYNETDEEAVYGAFNELLEADLGTTVEIKVEGAFGEYNERMPLILASGEKMDVLWTAVWSNDFLQNAADGFYAGLDDLLEEYGQDILADIRDQLEATRVDGEIRAVWSQQIAAYNSIFRVRMDLVEKYGWDLDSIESLADLEPWLAEVKENEAELIPFGPGSEAWKLIQPYYGIGTFGFLDGILGVRVDDDSLEVLNLTETPEYREWVDLMHRWQSAGYIPEDGLTYTRDQWSQLSNQARLALSHHNTYNPQIAEREVAGVLMKDVRVGEPMTLTSNITNTLHAVHTNSEQKEKAVQMLNWLWTNQEAYNTLVWGLEGQHYESIGDGRISPNQDSGYYTNLPWMWGNTFQSYLLPGQDAELFDEVRRMNDESLKANILGFNADRGEIRTLVASVSAVVDQYETPLEGGWVDPETGIPEFQAALDRAGFPELIEAMQAQVDAWAAVNR
jgi:putative aldouronate transport system substrate-binding protein